MSSLFKKKDEVRHAFLFDGASFMDWASQKEALFQTTHPLERIQTFLVEIQKRVLSDQVLILHWMATGDKAKVLQISPLRDKPMISSKVMAHLCEACHLAQKLLSLDQLETDLPWTQRLAKEHVNSLLISPLNQHESEGDYLLVLNPTTVQFPGKVSDFVSAFSSVLGLALQNARLYVELKKKTAQLKNWSEDVERRIKEGTKRLLEQEFQFHALFEGANDGIVVHDRNGTIYEANHVACQLLGYSRKRLIEIQWRQIVPTGKLNEQETFFEQILQKTTDRPLESQLLKANGMSFHAEISSRRVWFHGKEAIQSFIRNVSLRKQLEVSLKESRKKYRMLVESSLVGVFNIRGEAILFVNGQFESLVGYGKQELYNMGMGKLIHPEDKSWLLDRERRRENGEEVPDHYEARLIHKSGHIVWCEIRACRVVQNSQPTILGNIIDISERKSMALELLESKKMESISTLAGGIAHDFNNLLGGILGYSSLLLSDMTPSHPYYSDIETISRTAKRAAELTNRLLAFARGGKYQVRTLDMGKIVQRILPMLKDAMNQSMMLKTRLADSLWPVKGDSQQLQQALLNVCINGVEALNGTGELSLEASNVHLEADFAKDKLGLDEGGDYVRIVIADNGRGMDEKTLSRIFEPFFTTKTFGDGAGLGMAMVYGVTKNHGGAVLVDSALKKGTTVTLYLPRLGEVQQQAIQTAIQKTQLSNRILLVDDELVIREVGKRMLEKGGFEVLIANDGIQALAVYKEKGAMIDLVLLDWMMPRMGGKETSRRIREINPQAQICFLSGYSPQDKPELLQMGDQFFIQKPFQTDALIKTIQKILHIPAS